MHDRLETRHAMLGSVHPISATQKRWSLGPPPHEWFAPLKIHFLDRLSTHWSAIPTPSSGYAVLRFENAGATCCDSLGPWPQPLSASCGVARRAGRRD